MTGFDGHTYYGLPTVGFMVQDFTTAMHSLDFWQRTGVISIISLQL